MELEDTSQPAVTQYTGRETVVIPAGKTLKIETAPDGEDILSEEVPAGKTWTANITVRISES